MQILQNELSLNFVPQKLPKGKIVLNNKDCYNVTLENKNMKNSLDSLGTKTP